MTDKTEILAGLLKRRGLRVVTAESCTGGLIAKMLTDMPGASALFERGFVTYSNDSKREMLDVPLCVLSRHGAVSEETAGYMARGALRHSRANIGLACTGVAGPGGGSAEKPVGLVYLALAADDDTLEIARHDFPGTREDVRRQTAEAGISMLIDYLRAGYLERGRHEHDD